MHTPRKPKLILLFLATAAFIAAAVLSLANDAASGQAVCFMRAAIPDHLPDAPAHAPVSSLLIHGVPAPYDAQTGVYYVPLSLKNGLANAKLSWKNAAESACLAADGAESDLAGAIADGHAFTLLISGRQGEYTQKVIFTALPMLVSKTLSDDTIKAAEDKASAKFTYFDPAGSDDGGYRILSGAGTKKLHGHYSRNYSKSPTAFLSRRSFWSARAGFCRCGARAWTIC